MVISGNARRRLIATACVLALAGGAAATSENPPEGRPDAGEVVRAYLTLATWVRALDPPSPSTEAARLPIVGATGVCVVLRHRGRVMGAGVDATGDDLMVRRAGGRATGQVLGHRTVAALPESIRATVGEQLVIELEVAGALTPMPGRSFAQIAEQLEPGLDGVAMRRGDDVAWLFPAQMQAAGTADDLARVIPSLAVELGLPAAAPGDLAARFGARVYRFSTIHLAQAGPGRLPFETIRGQALVPRDAVTPDGLREFAERLADHLYMSLWAHDEPLGLMGDYDVVADSYEPLVAGPRDQALAAFALARCAQAPGWRRDVGASMREAALAILVELSAVTEMETSPFDDAAACAAIVYAADALGPAGDDPAVNAIAAEAARRVDRVLSEPLEGAVGLSPHAVAMVVGAGARRLAPLDTPGAEVVRAALDALWDAAPAHRRVELLPWLGWAELDYARATGEPLARVRELQALREALGRARLDAATDPTIPADLDGGFDLTRGAGGRPVATAQTARPAAFLASIVREPALTPVERREAEREQHARTMRFLLQLAMSDDMRRLARAYQRARGGVRAAPWSLNEPTAAQALALLAAAETLLSLDPPEPAGQKLLPQSPPAE